ncbi:MAG: SDR family oxidoreductase [Acidimicrobiia bacterium]|nr:SDR family oxidoreductase [Acidimicrobiia bacterium]
MDDRRGPRSGPRFEGKVAVVVGAGQTPGATIGNGRATSILLASEGATLLAVDRDEDSAAETLAKCGDGVTASTLRADITSEADCARIAEVALERYGHIDVLVNNVGIGAGDAGATSLEEDAWDLIHDVNLKGMWMTCKHVLPHLRRQGSGSVVNISSVASVCATPYLAYKTSKAGVNALTQQLAMSSARRGVRVNAVLPGLMDTPMAVEGIAAATDIDPDELRSLRDALVPLGAKQGSAWDVAHAVAYLASDEARFVTGVLLPVDGGQSAKVG